MNTKEMAEQVRMFYETQLAQAFADCKPVEQPIKWADVDVADLIEQIEDGAYCDRWDNDLVDEPAWVELKRRVCDAKVQNQGPDGKMHDCP